MTAVEHQSRAAGVIIGDLPVPDADAAIPLFKVAMAETAVDAVGVVLRSGYIGQGSKVEEFEAALRSRVVNPNLVTLNSATSGLHLALHLLREPNGGNFAVLRDGDEVLTTPLTCTATNWPILANRMQLRWVDVDPNTCNMDLDDLERKITAATKAVMVVHWGGYPVDLDRLATILDAAADRFGHRVAVIEDCAHAWASTYKGMPLGNHGNFATFSFQAIKHLTSGDGGALVVPTDDLLRQAKLLRWYGIDREDNGRGDFRCEADIAQYGFKFHMNDINAAIGLANLSIIDDVIARHRANAAFYDDRLGSVDGVTMLERAPDRESSFWIYTVKVQRRDDFMRKLQGAGIAVSRVHERNDIHSCVAQYTAPLPQLDTLIQEMVCFPVGWWVNDEQRSRIADTIASGW